MRRIMLLALLAPALPMAALANSFSFIHTDTGTFISGSITSSFSPHFRISVVGSMNQIVLNTSTLGSCSSNGRFETCTFSNGIVNVKRGGATVFEDGIVSGTVGVCRPPNCRSPFLAVIDAILKPINGFPAFVTFSNVRWHFDDTLFAGRADLVHVSTAPDASPGTFGLLLGTGLIGLPALTRHKLKLGT